MAQSHEVWASNGINATARAARTPFGMLTEGVRDLASNEWKVTAQNSPNMTVRVGSGTAYDTAYVQGDASAGQGIYAIRNQDAYVGNGNTDLEVSPGDANFTRHDLVVLRMYDDDEDSSGRNEAVVEIIEGAPAANPADPAVPDSALVLGRIVVPPNENTSITDSDIVDLRVQAGIITPLTQALEDRIAHEEARLIGTIVAGGSGSQSFVQFDNIPQDYSQLKLYGQIGHTGSAAFESLRIRFNDVATEDYYYVYNETQGGDSTPTTRFGNGNTGVNSQIGLRGTLELTIPAYTEAISPKSFHMTTSYQIGTANTSHKLRQYGGQWFNAGPVTKISLSITSGPDFSNRTILTLIGEG